MIQAMTLGDVYVFNLKMLAGSQLFDITVSLVSSYSRGQTKLLYVHKKDDNKNPNMMVEKAPPMNPSHVFLGDNLIKRVFPKKKPNMYAIISLHIIKETGKRNHMSPSNTFCIIKFD